MIPKFVHAALAITLCLAVSLAYGQGRGKESKKTGGEKEKSAGESKSERKPEGKSGNEKNEKSGRESAKKTEHKEGAKSTENNPGGAWSERTHSGKQSGDSTASGAKGAAAGEAAAKKKSPQATGAEGAAAGAAAAKRNTSKVSGAAGEAAGYAAVRSSFNQPSMYGKQWYGSHPGAWSSAGWSSGAAWTAASWTAVAGYVGYANTTPISYHYGDNVTYQDGNVMLDNEKVGTAAEFSQQAADLAQIGIDAQVSDTEEWMPLGVFALVRNEQQHPQLILQFAINKQGILRGNYTDEVSGQTSPIQGAVEERTQRAAWTVGGNTRSVMEAGLNNLTESEAPVLIHRNGKTDHWILVRLNNDNGNEAGTGK